MGLNLRLNVRGLCSIGGAFKIAELVIYLLFFFLAEKQGAKSFFGAVPESEPCIEARPGSCYGNRGFNFKHAIIKHPNSCNIFIFILPVCISKKKFFENRRIQTTVWSSVLQPLFTF
jgi:hypothetical protein